MRLHESGASRDANGRSAHLPVTFSNPRRITDDGIIGTREIHGTVGGHNECAEFSPQ